MKEARWVEDGQFVTSSGVSAGIDMALAVIARLAGAGQRQLAIATEYEWHRDAAWDPFANPRAGLSGLPMRAAQRGVALLTLALALLAGDSTVAARPRVAILANNSGTETTDLLTPFAVLTDAPGHRAHLGRGWRLGGVDLRRRRVLANAGLLDGHRATGHWYSLGQLRKIHPRTDWRQDVRWVRDRNIITSAGVSASEPLAQHLAALLARQGGWPPVGDGPPHDGARFAIGAGDVATGAVNYLLPWRWEVAALLEVIEASGEARVQRRQPPQPDEDAHDLDVDLNGAHAA